jgi:RNA recognition motif-containing protein
MSKQLFVGNLDSSTADTDLHAAFLPMGALVSASVILDRATGQSRGFGFVEFQTAADAGRAIQSLHGSLLDGREIRVSLAHERRPR